MSKRLSVAETTIELQGETNLRNGEMSMDYGTWKHPLGSTERTQNVTE